MTREVWPVEVGVMYFWNQLFSFFSFRGVQSSHSMFFQMLPQSCLPLTWLVRKIMGTKIN